MHAVGSTERILMGYMIRHGLRSAAFRVFALASFAVLAACSGSGMSGGTLPASGPINNGGDTSGIPAPGTSPPGNGSVDATPNPKGTPPAPNPTASAASPNATISSTLGRIGLFQAFDMHLTPAQRSAAGPRYDLVWGGNYPSQWQTNHSSLLVSSYFIIEQSDAAHTLAWYQANHPDWVLYNCTSAGTPTRTIAYMPGESSVPLDIRNRAVIDFQIRTMAAPPAIAKSYNALAFDQVVFTNPMGGNAGSGSYGCGVYQGGNFVPRYNGKRDPAWAADTVNWVKTARGILTSDPTIAPHHLKLIINHPAGDISDPNEQSLLTNVDGAVNEVGFSDYGNYTKEPARFATSLNYMTYEQAQGVVALVIDKFIQSDALTAVQREWSIGTYLMGNDGAALLYATYGGLGTGGYGVEYYYPEYSTNMGTPCGAVYKDSSSPDVYLRAFQNGLVAVNASSKAAEPAHLPLVHIYTDIERRTVTVPLTVPATNSFVMTTVAGTGCL